MKKFIIGGLVVLAVLLMVIPGVIYASGLFTKEVPAEAIGTVSTPITLTPDLKVYSDSAATTEITVISFGSFDIAGSQTVNVYLKNVGERNFGNIAVTSNLTTSEGTLTVSGDNVSLATGVTIPLTLTLNLNDVGTFDFVISFNGTY